MNAPRLRSIVAAAAVAALVSAAGATSAPSNDVVAHAQLIPSVPAVIDSTTEGAKLTEGDLAVPCAGVESVVWYVVRAPRHGALVARVKAGGELDGAIVVYRILRAERVPVMCARTDRHGKAVVAWNARLEDTYAIGVARRAKSVDGPFRLTVVAAEPAAIPPGQALVGGSVHDTVDPILDPSDAWAVQLDPGTTYRINLTSPGNCLALDLYRPGVYRFRLSEPVRSHECGGFSVFTPGIDGGGVYSLVVRAKGTKPVLHGYRLHVAANGIDDGAPGIKLTNGATVAGDLFGRGVDNVDLYRFGVPRPDELTTIDLHQKPSVGFDLLLLREAGDRVACACDAKGRQVLREHLAPGSYFVAVRSREGSGGKYSLNVLTREVTSTSISVNGSTAAEVPPATSVSFTVQVTSASQGGQVQIEIDRLDPLIGWQFAQVLTQTVDASGTLVTSWTPPWVGFFRARARFLGTPFSTFSSSGYARVHVAEPLE